MFIKAKITTRALIARRQKRGEKWYQNPESLKSIYPELSGAQPCYQAADQRYMAEMNLLCKQLKTLCDRAGVPQPEDKDKPNYEALIKRFLTNLVLRLDPKTRVKSDFVNHSDQELGFLKYNFEVILVHHLEQSKESKSTARAELVELINTLGKCETGVYDEFMTLKEAYSKPKQLVEWVVGFRHDQVRSLSSEWIILKKKEGRPVIASYEKHVPSFIFSVLAQEGIADDEISYEDRYLPRIHRAGIPRQLYFIENERNDQIRYYMSLNDFNLNAVKENLKKKMCNEILDALASKLEFELREAFELNSMEGLNLIISQYKLDKDLGMSVYNFISHDEDYEQFELFPRERLYYWCLVAAAALLENEGLIETSPRKTLREASGSWFRPNAVPAIELVSLPGLSYLVMDGKILCFEVFADLLKQGENLPAIEILAQMDETGFELMTQALSENGVNLKIKDLSQRRELVKKEFSKEYFNYFDTPRDLTQNLKNLVSFKMDRKGDYLVHVESDPRFQLVFRRMSDEELRSHLECLKDLGDLATQYLMLILDIATRDQKKIILSWAWAQHEGIVIMLSETKTYWKQREILELMDELPDFVEIATIMRQELVKYEISLKMPKLSLRNMSDFILIWTLGLSKDKFEFFLKHKTVTDLIVKFTTEELNHFLLTVDKTFHPFKIYNLLSRDQFISLVQLRGHDLIVQDIAEILRTSTDLVSYLSARRLYERLIKQFDQKCPLSHGQLLRYKEKFNEEIRSKKTNSPLIFDGLHQAFELLTTTYRSTTDLVYSPEQIRLSPCFDLAVSKLQADDLFTFIPLCLMSLKPAQARYWVSEILNLVSEEIRVELLPRLSLRALASYDNLTLDQLMANLHLGELKASEYPHELQAYIKYSSAIFYYLKSENIIPALNDLYADLDLKNPRDFEQYEKILKYIRNLRLDRNYYTELDLPKQKEILENDSDYRVIQVLDSSLPHYDAILRMAKAYRETGFENVDPEMRALIIRAYPWNISLPLSNYWRDNRSKFTLEDFNRAYSPVWDLFYPRMEQIFQDEAQRNHFKFLDYLHGGEGESPYGKFFSNEVPAAELIKHLQGVSPEFLAPKRLSDLIRLYFVASQDFLLIKEIRDFMRPYVGYFIQHHGEEFQGWVRSWMKEFNSQFVMAVFNDSDYPEKCLLNRFLITPSSLWTGLLTGLGSEGVDGYLKFILKSIEPGLSSQDRLEHVNRCLSKITELGLNHPRGYRFWKPAVRPEVRESLRLLTQMKQVLENSTAGNQAEQAEILSDFELRWAKYLIKHHVNFDERKYREYMLAV